MDQEVRNSDIFTVLANLVDSQSHGMQSSQNNNNNSNPTHFSRQNAIGTDTGSVNSEAQTSTSQVMNAHLLNIPGQPSAGTIPVSGGSASDAEIADIERLSIFMNPNFPNASGIVANQTQDPLYEAASQIGMQTEVGSMLDSRLPPYSSTAIDFSSSQNQALLEAFNTIDTSAVAGLSCAQSYVSLLQQQTGELWPAQSNIPANGNYTVNLGNKQHSGGNTRMPLNQGHGNTAQSSSVLDKTPLPSQDIHSNSNKSAMHMQHSSGIQTPTKGGRSTQQYHSNNTGLQYRQNSKNRNDLVLPVDNDGLPLMGESGNRGKEKKLTTTPIPSDAEKSSCSSTSSGSISGPEQSPDHMSEQQSGTTADLSRRTLDDSVLLGDLHLQSSQTDPRDIRNIENTKNYPCYGKMNLVNFGTINFAPVMENSHNSTSSADVSRNSQDGNVPVPTSDSVIEIDETVTSPLENIPMSPTTPMVIDQGGSSMSQSFGDMQKMNAPGRGSFAQMQTVTAVHQVRNVDSNSHSVSRKSKSRTVDSSRRIVSGHKLIEPNGNSTRVAQDYSKNFASLSTVTQDNLQEKQKKPRGSKYKQSQQRRDDFQPSMLVSEPLQFGYINSNSVTQASHLKPKVNADPTVRLKQGGDTLVHPSLNQFKGQSVAQGNPPLSAISSTKQIEFTSRNPIYSGQASQNRSSAKNSYATSGVVQTPSTTAKTRTWQTVTAVQGPKLPPMLSEQDRIPKRGRPSKKMMQQNLKVKKDNAGSTSQTLQNIPTSQPAAPAPDSVQPRLPSSNLVSTYTINSNGLMEEIAPRPKENRRSKERTQAFLKYLDEIKISSKQQRLASDAKLGEKEKGDSEKQKKRSRPRTKVFGRQVSQPLTESGITATMYTFSALAHQFKISSSIVERATENLLKSAAVKRSKEQQNSALSIQNQRFMPDKNNNKSQQPLAQSGVNKGVPLVSSHCEPNKTTSSNVLNVPTIKLPSSSTLRKADTRQSVPSSTSPESITDKVLRIQQEVTSSHARSSSSIGPKISADTVSVPTQSSPKEIAADSHHGPEVSSNIVNLSVDTRPESVSDSDQASSKGKHKKKKHKKHKKHKYADSASGKKKKKDKDRKKKSRKKMKSKPTPSIIPSSSVSLVKPATKAVLLTEKDDTETPKSDSKMPSFESQDRMDHFSSGFRQAENIDLDTSSWQQDENTYDVEDSSSDEASVSPNSNADAAVEPTSKSSNNPPLFAQYSNSRIGFGTFSIPAPKSSDSKTPKLPSTSITTTITNAKDNKNSSFSSQNLARSDKKHSKHKKKKLFRKSKTCDPAFAAILDELLDGIKDLQLASNAKPVSQMSKSSGNIFFSTSTVDTTQSLLWRSPATSSTSRKTITSVTKGTSFPKDIHGSTLGDSRIGGAEKAQFGLNKSKSMSQTSEEPSECLSVFCRSAFFQKYGYIAQSGNLPTKPLPVTKSKKPAQVVAKSNNTPKKMSAETSKPGDRTIIAQVRSTSAQPPKVTTETDVDPAPSRKEEQVTQPLPQGKRKRGWPRGKPRGPRPKKTNLSHSSTALAQDNTRSLTIDKKHDSIGGDDNETEIDSKSKSVRSKESSSAGTVKKSVSDQEGPDAVNTADEAVPADDLSKIVNDSLVQQIKQAIEAKLPKHVNKDAITKSVDDAVQSYLQNITKTLPQPLPTTEHAKKKPLRRRSRNEAIESNQKAVEEMSPKANTDIHPKKLWACKHQDTESFTVSRTSHNLQSLPLVQKKRGPGRPRKNPLPDPSPSKRTLVKPNSSMLKQGKVPTASATVVPSKRKLTVRLGSKPAVKPAVKRLIARVRNDATTRTTLNQQASQRSALITKEAAYSCLNALCSIKAAKVLAKSGDKDGDSKLGFYSGTQVEMNILEAIATTVEMYQWDNYKQFEDACSKVEQEMGFVDESDSPLSDNRPKTLGIKKSIESVVEKLKNKQAQSMHSAATALLELHSTGSTPAQDFDDDNIVIIDHRNGESNEKYRMPGRRQEIYEKVSSYKKDLSQSSKPHKVKASAQRFNTSLDGAPVKRPRGRPRKHPIPTELEPPLKKLKMGTVETSQHEETIHPLKDPEPTSTRPKHQKGVTTVSSASEGSNPTLSLSKPYISAGLYSSTFKKDPKSPRQSLGDLSASRAKLPAPFDAGLYLRSTLKDFQLPYDIWWMYKHGKISPSQDPSTNYIEITENVYTSPRPTLNLGDHICTCNPTEGENCGKECLNRLMYIECQTSSCPCGQSCTNQVIQSGRWRNSLERFKTKDRGWGVRTTKAVSEGTFILEYVGEVVSEAEFRMRTVEVYHAYNNHYYVQLDASTVIDGYRMANEARFINHSCEPNCAMQKWCVNGEYRIGLFAIQQIGANEELTYDYDLHAYNMNARQNCRCGSQKCRGFIGGHAQRSANMDSDVLSNVPVMSVKQAKVCGKQTKLKSFKSKGEETTVKEFSILQMKPISKKDKEIIRSQQLFLLRNLAQVRRKEEEQRKKLDKKSGDPSSSGKSVHKSRAKKGQPTKEESEKLEAALTEMYTAIATCKDQNGVSVAIPFMNLPSKKKNPEYYKTITDPIDLSIIERNIVSNHYKDIETFNNDVQRVFKNAEKYHGRKSTLGKDVFRLRKAYANARGAAMLLLNGHKKPTKSSELSDENLDEADENIHRKNEDHIRCICCIYKDEGLMVQCEKCYVWQHCDCMGVKPGNTDRYLCEECDPRPFSKEVKVIPPPPNTPPGHTYYLTLLRDDLLVKQGDCAYLMRDHRLRHSSNTPSVRASHRNLATIPPDKLDIFRVEQLWTDEGGDKYAYGYHFLRPHETHHSPSRTFYHNELFASPFYEIIPLEAVVGLCCVMDLYTYCKGKPKDFKMCDIYICDYRIDKAAGCFTRITKKRYPICTKPHVFDTYKHKICPKKDFQPHHVPEHYRKSSGRPPNGARDEDVPEFVSSYDEEQKERRTSSQGDEDVELLGRFSFFDGNDFGSPMWRKRKRLDGIAHKLLSKLPKQAVDVSYLLEPGTGKRQRKKTQLSMESLSQQK